jgi:Fe-S cluster assembly protein SufD
MSAHRSSAVAVPDEAARATAMPAATGTAAADVLARAREHWLRLAVHPDSPLAGRGLKLVEALRDEGRAVLEARGFPTPRDDDWKYTRLNSLAEIPFAPARPRNHGPLPHSTLLGELDLGGLRLLVRNGRFDAEASKTGVLPRGVRVLGLRAALAEMPARLEPVLGQVGRTAAHGLSALNAALFGDGVVVLLERGVTLETPVHVVFAGAPSGAEAAFVRTLVIAEEGSRASVVEHFISQGGGVYLTSAMTEVAVAPGAAVTHYKIEEEAESAFHVGSVEARVACDGRFASHLVAIGGRLARNEVRVALAAEGAECTLNGLYMPSRGQHIDCFTHIEHRVPRGTSTQLYKGVLAEGGRGVWTGRILVAAGAQKTSALQTNKNLLLSESAHVDTRPQLEIYADDVKCSHGAAVGRLDADALFYLRSRGIDEAQARELLTYAFASEVVSQMPEKRLTQALERRLAAGLLQAEEVAA